MVASKKDWLEIFNSLSDSVREANNYLNEYLREFIDSNNHKKITGKQNRIKSDVSFADKLVRNNYINDWKYDEGNVEANKKTLSSNLPDFIGYSSIYKPNNFDFRIDEKKKNVEEIWKTLTSCDEQLYLLSKETYEKDKLLKQLLTIYLEDSNLVDPLNSHYLYSIFFNVFTRKDNKVLEELLIQLMSSKKIERKIKLTLTELEHSTVYDDLNKILSTILHKDELESIKKIFEYCFESIEHETFLNVIIFSIMKYFQLDSESEIEDEGLDNFKEDDEEEQAQKDNMSSLLTLLKTYGFKTKRIKLDESE